MCWYCRWGSERDKITTTIKTWNLIKKCSIIILGNTTHTHNIFNATNWIGFGIKEKDLIVCYFADETTWYNEIKYLFFNNSPTH